MLVRALRYVVPRLLTATGLALVLRRLTRPSAGAFDAAALFLPPKPGEVPAFDARTLLRPLPDVVLVTRGAGGAREVRWRGAQHVRVEVADAPDRALRLLARGGPASGLTLHDGDPLARRLFRVTLGDQPPVMAAERTLPMDAVPNLRDIGGYRTEQGRTVRWGLVYRSGTLAAPTARDLDQLEALGLRLVCDLRTANEATARPDVLPPGVPLLHTPVLADMSRRARLRAVRMLRADPSALALEGYTRTVIDENAAVVGTVLGRIAGADALPILVHCTAGKDRTGVIMALLLRWLGVPEEAVLADYALSNEAYDAIVTLSADAVRVFGVLGLGPRALVPLFAADAEILRGTFAHIDARYGSLEAYLRGPAGLDTATLLRLRALLLE